MGVAEEERDNASLTEMVAAPECAHKMAVTAEPDRKMVDTTTPRHAIAASHEPVNSQSILKSQIKSQFILKSQVKLWTWIFVLDLRIIFVSPIKSQLIVMSLFTSPLIFQSLFTSSLTIQSFFTPPLTIQSLITSPLTPHVSRLVRPITIGLHLSPVSLFDLHACSENCIFYYQCCCSHIMHGISCFIQSLKGSQSYSIYHYVE